MEILGEVRREDGGILQLGSRVCRGERGVYRCRGACNDAAGKRQLYNDGWREVLQGFQAIGVSCPDVGVAASWGGWATTTAIQTEKRFGRCFYSLQNDVVLMLEQSKWHRFDAIKKKIKLFDSPGSLVGSSVQQVWLWFNLFLVQLTETVTSWRLNQVVCFGF